MGAFHALKKGSGALGQVRKVVAPSGVPPEELIYLRTSALFASICAFLRPTAFATTAFGNCRHVETAGETAGQTRGSGGSAGGTSAEPPLPCPKNLLRLFFRNSLARQKNSLKKQNDLARLFLCLF